MISTTIFGSLLFALSINVCGSSIGEAIEPSHQSAEENANLVFNAIHSAARQWGSSLYHNGFSFFPAVVPRGTLLYHGAHQNQTPTGLEWLAFEIEHAESFAGSYKSEVNRPLGLTAPKRPKLNDQKYLAKDRAHCGEFERRHSGTYDQRAETITGNCRGYLHVYQASRDLDLLLIDGMSAGKTTMGTLDSQDLLLRENNTNHGGFEEYLRAYDLCDLAIEWGYAGLVRMEIGFEIIYCNFDTGVDLVSVTRTRMPANKLGDNELAAFEWIRAGSERYNGVGDDRLRVDYSSMVSALFFPINISSTDIDRPDLLRLEAAHLDELKSIKQYLKSVATQPRRFTVNWQALIDQVVSRFAKRLAAMSSPSLPLQYFIDEVEAITLIWLDAPQMPDDISIIGAKGVNETAEAIDSCRKHYLRPAMVLRELWSLQDELIFTSIDTVMESICSRLFFVRNMLLEASSGSGLNEYRIRRDMEGKQGKKLKKAVDAGRRVVWELRDALGWSTWKQKQPCPAEEVLFIAMWPFGDENDHYNPGCRSIEAMMQQPVNNSYWGTSWGQTR